MGGWYYMISMLAFFSCIRLFLLTGTMISGIFPPNIRSKWHHSTTNTPESSRVEVYPGVHRGTQPRTPPTPSYRADVIRAPYASARGGLGVAGGGGTPPGAAPAPPAAPFSAAKRARYSLIFRIFAARLASRDSFRLAILSSRVPRISSCMALVLRRLRLMAWRREPILRFSVRTRVPRRQFSSR